MKLGARILKTGIAIALAIYTCTLLGLPAPVFAGVSAIFALQPSVYRSYRTMIEQFQANIVGALFAVVFALAFGNNPLIIGLACVIVISISLKLKMQDSVSIALVTIVAIMEYTGEDFLQFALLRFTTIMIGVVAASIVNLIFLPPKYETKVYTRISENTEEIIKWLRLSTRQACEHGVMKEEIDRLKEKMIKLRYFYLLYKEERHYFQKRVDGAKARKLVLFRQMITTANRAFETLKKLHRFENELHQMPKDLQDMIKNELDCLANYHEQIILKFIGKVKTQSQDDLLEEMSTCKHALMSTFMKYRNEDDEEQYRNWLQLLKVISAITDYSDELEHLDCLVESFHKYHQGTNELEIEELGTQE